MHEMMNGAAHAFSPYFAACRVVVTCESSGRLPGFRHSSIFQESRDWGCCCRYCSCNLLKKRWKRRRKKKVLPGTKLNWKARSRLPIEYRSACLARHIDLYSPFLIKLDNLHNFLIHVLSHFAATHVAWAYSLLLAMRTRLLCFLGFLSFILSILVAQDIGDFLINQLIRRSDFVCLDTRKWNTVPFLMLTDMSEKETITANISTVQTSRCQHVCQNACQNT